MTTEELILRNYDHLIHVIDDLLEWCPEVSYRPGVTIEEVMYTEGHRNLLLTLKTAIDHYEENHK